MLVGGLTAAEAREILTARFSRPLRLVGGPGARIAVSPADLGAVAHIAAAVQLAARIRRPGFAVPLKVDISGSKVDRLVASLAKRFNREPVEATLRLHDFRPIATRDVSGRRLRAVVAARAISLALKTQQRHPLELSFDENAAPVSSNDLGRAIVIRRASNELYLYRIGTKPKLIRMFRVATGRPQYPTPLGKFEVVNMQLHPWWYPPVGSEWAKGAEPIPPGPGNPLGTRWMGISSPNVGIHGTSSPSSIGYSASHGCIRMLISDAEWLYEKVDLGTPVFIVAA
ncbi:MAG: L,D-transpeptidase family protein [Thermoleophilia bacterium]